MQINELSEIITENKDLAYEIGKIFDSFGIP